MDYDFDTPLNLKGTHSSKFDAIERVFGFDAPDMIPMWVADMDFAAAPPIRAALQAEIERGYFGYHTNTAPIDAAIAAWYRDRHGWNVEAGSIRYTHGVISGFGDVIAGFSEPGDGVVLFAPVYHAFYRQIRAMGREVVESPLVPKDGTFHMDLAGLGAALTGRERIVVLCSPHNPGGRIWTEAEIREVADFCAGHGLLLISDEIHLDLKYPGAAAVPAAVAVPEHADRLVILTAASKAFNIAGGETGLLIAPDAKLRAALDKVILDRESSPNRFGIAMTHAAFSEGGDWLDAVNAYIAENFRLFADRMNALPGVSVMEMQATYLAWADFSALGMTDKELLHRVLRTARIAPSPGTQFGIGGSGHLRFNLALPRPTLRKALDRLDATFSDIQ
jgi:cystathionine beta-lyase